MDKTVSDLIRTIISEFLPIEIVKDTWSSLSNKDWNVFFRITSLVGFIIQVIAATIVVVMFIVLDILTSPSILGALWALVSKSVLFGIVLYVSTWLISLPIDEITGEREPRTQFDSGSLHQALLGLFWLFLSVAWRYGIYRSDIDIFSQDFARSIGTIAGIIISDSIYFGGLMVGFGFICQSYTILRADESTD